MIDRVVAIAVWAGSIGLLLGCGDESAGSATDPLPDGGTATLVCPAEPPTDGATCSDSGRCSYLRCAGEGLVVGVCNGGTWSMSATPCEEHDCFGDTCSATQLCHDQSSGAAFGTCVDNPCGDGPLSCDCLISICGSSPGCSVTDLRTFRCSAPCEGCP